MNRLHVPAALRQGPFTVATARAAGIGPGTLAGPGYRRLLRGIYQAAELPVAHDARIAAVRALPGGTRTILVGPSAAWALGCRLAEPDDPVHVGVTGWDGDRELLIRHPMRLRDDDLVMTGHGCATSAARTIVDLARGVGTSGLPVHRHVAWLDGLLRATGLTAAQARQAMAAASGLHGVPGGVALVHAARNGVDSPKETELRLLVARFGFPEPVVQCPIPGPAGRIIARADLGWPIWCAGLEYDGAVHREPGQHSRDLERHNRIRDAGWQVLQIDARGLARPGRFLTALARRVPGSKIAS